jgi:hypothetical protein
MLHSIETGTDDLGFWLMNDPQLQRGRSGEHGGSGAKQKGPKPRRIENREGSQDVVSEGSCEKMKERGGMSEAVERNAVFLPREIGGAIPRGDPAACKLT